MRLEPDKSQFQPINIALETPAEVEAFYILLRVIADPRRPYNLDESHYVDSLDMRTNILEFFRKVRMVR